jgi:hypothetical protein
MPMNSLIADFENQGAGRLVLKNDELRKRTVGACPDPLKFQCSQIRLSVGVLTKVDRVEPGGASKWLEIFHNKQNHLPWGWFCVKQPDLLQLQAGISREDAKANETQFFESTSPWSGLDQQHRVRLGSEGLAEELGIKLADLVDKK